MYTEKEHTHSFFKQSNWFFLKEWVCDALFFRTCCTYFTLSRSNVHRPVSNLRQVTAEAGGGFQPNSSSDHASSSRKGKDCKVPLVVHRNLDRYTVSEEGLVAVFFFSWSRRERWWCMGERGESAWATKERKRNKRKTSFHWLFPPFCPSS